MPALLPLVIGASAIIAIARRVIIGLGFGMIAYVGLSAIVGQIQAAMFAALNIPGEAQTVICLLQLQNCVTILISGMSVKAAMIPAKRMGLI